ncbi:hypothetical protein [Streptomyces showdoensis]|nr:hypothetical protein [Streptomyces showdoensis]
MQTTQNHIPKENQIMAREKQHKTVYTAKWGDKRHLLAVAKPGDILYVIHDIGDRYVMGVGTHGYSDPQMYSVWVVVNERAYGSGNLMVIRASNTTGRGEISLSTLIHKEREIHTLQPAALRCLHDNTSVAKAHELADRVTKQHAEQVALANADKTLAGAGGGKKSWF